MVESHCCNRKDDSVQQQPFRSGPAYRHRIRDRIFLGLRNISRDLLASESWAAAYRLQPCRRGIQQLAAVTERRGKRQVTPPETIQVVHPQRVRMKLGVIALCAGRAEERGDLGVPR
ncbi:unnamed protein product [Leuciscus chuanchicus]